VTSPPRPGNWPTSFRDPLQERFEQIGRLLLLVLGMHLVHRRTRVGCA
jgi:hypothetical protein